MLQFFIGCPSRGLPKYIKTKFLITCFYLIKKRSGTSLPVTFSASFFKQKFRTWYSINWPNLIAWLPLILEILANICVVIICLPVCDAINVENNLSFLIRPVFLHSQKVRTKIKRKCNVNLKNVKSSYHEKMHFSSF